MWYCVAVEAAQYNTDWNGGNCIGVQRAINGQLITWEVIVYGFLGMEQVAARYKDPWKAAVYCCEHNCAEVKMALSEPDEPLPTND